MARTNLHECIHADMLRKLNSKQLLNLEEMNFKLVYEHFKDKNFNPSQTHHETMAELYVVEMAKALEDFHKNALSSDYNDFINYYGTPPNSTFYEALAWRGLKDGDVQAWKDLTPKEKQAIDVESGKLNMLTKNCN
ncbi:hypothetical protein [Leeuwenhoekiella sp. MAR_2009_132]|uniref:hypothetical protein n=1 Tax=Leeuwenhoekiella sp. MAR_2009_132 TaxID=1392489 RepID=UPI000F688F8D|nr:hypothetical protein [Leeuwenhoekiella sp. MAR_2009_132]